MFGQGYRPIAGVCHLFLYIYPQLRLYWSEHRSEIPLLICAAFDEKHKLHKRFQHRRSHFAFTVGLVPKTKGIKLANIPTIHLSKLKKAYPPHGHDIYETEETQNIWRNYQAKTLYPDRRGGRTWKPLLKLDSSKLQYTVGEHESAIIQDAKTDDVIGIVIRDFSNNNPRLLNWINGIIEENTGERRSVRVSSAAGLT